MPPKKKIQDILPSKRRSIRDVYLDDERPKKSRMRAEISRADRGVRVPIHLEHKAEEKHTPTPAPASPKTSRRDKKSKYSRNFKWILGGTIIICLAIVTYVTSIFLAYATIKITPRSENVSVNGTFSASQNAQSPELAFETISTTTSVNMTVPAVEGSAMTFATGMAMLINKSSPSSQLIVANTRLKDSRGLVYKTMSTVVIPPSTSKTAGTVSVKVIASEPGPAYNSSLKNLEGDLSIVAWNGTAKAKIFYGRMITDVTGGSSGPQMIVASTTLNSAETSLSTKILSLSQTALQDIVPDGYILYPRAADISFSSTTIDSAGSTTATLSMSADATGFIFKKVDLENTLAKDKIAQFPADNYEVEGLNSLVFTPIAGQTFSPSTSSIKFSLSGTIDIVGSIDASVIKNQLQGKPLSASNSIFSQYSSVISGAQVSVVPFWIRTIPSSPNRISVVVSTSTNEN